MKRFFSYAFTLLAALAFASCGGNDTHSHSTNSHSQEHGAACSSEHSHDGHTHEAHSHSHEHGAACSGEHSHDGHTHEAHAHSHEHGVACSGEHSHDGHTHEAHAHSHEHGGEGHNYPSGSNIVNFPLAQQGKIDFKVEAVAEANLDGAVRVAARVGATPDNEASMVAAGAGRLRYAGNIVEGKEVRAGDVLFWIESGDVSENDAAVRFAAAESDYLVAKADYERKQALFGNKIVSEKELQAAEALVRRTEAHYNSMKRSFSDGRMVIKAPFAGYVASVAVTNGEYVSAGTVLATVQREGEVNIAAEVPVRHAASLRNITSVNIEFADGSVLPLDEAGGRVVAVGRAANSCNMIPVTVSAKGAQFVPGSIVTLHLASSLPDGRVVTVVPRTALVEEMGNFFVFVQQCSDSFEKREVKIGNSDGKYTQILSGLHKGEKVVSRGAVSLKLSQAAGALDPHAGHVH
ncbi:MAG: efflux RND transporter periplasmic adaptor subunit [Bacteroidaceae bacterium]|nr:efflux RND transporter periplasmic adaptor subunit [Bacteroidaceae bacterium]